MMSKILVSVIWIFVGTFPNNLCIPTGSTLPPILIDSSNNSSTTLPPKSVSEPFQFSEELLVFEPSDFTRAIGTFTVSAIPTEVASSLGNPIPGSRSLFATHGVADSKHKDQVFCRYEYYYIPLSNEPKRRVSVDDQFFKIKGSKVIYRVTAKFNDSVAQQFGKGKFSEDFSSLDEIAAGDSMDASPPTPIDFPKTVAKVLNRQRRLTMKKSPDSYESINAKKLIQRGIEQVIECYDEVVGPTSDGDKFEEEATSNLEQEKRRKYETRRRQEDERLEIENMRRERDRRKDREEARRRQEEDERRGFEDRLRARHEDERSDYEDRLQAREEKRRAEENNKSRHQEPMEPKYKNTLHVETNNHRRNYNKNRPMEDSQWGGGTKQNIGVDKQAQDSKNPLDEFKKLRSEMEHDSVQDSKKRLDEFKQVQSERERNPGQDRMKLSGEFKQLQSEMEHDSAQDSKKRLDEFKQVQSEKREQNPGQDRRKLLDEFRKLQSEMEQDSVQDSKKLSNLFKNDKSETQHSMQQYSDQDRKRLLGEFKKAQSEAEQDDVEFQRRQNGSLAETSSGNRNLAKKEPVQQGKGVQNDDSKRHLEMELVLAQYNVPAYSGR